MIYKQFQDKQLSALGMGAMRLPVINGDDNNIDQAQVQKMVDYAIENGINYFDTAWGYHGGNSETSLAKALSKYPRTSYYLADKFPGYDLDNMPKVAEIFEEQLRKCNVQYFDFYLFHNVCEMNIDAYLDPKFGIHDYLIKQKAAGRIHHLGFSAHGSLQVMQRFLDAYAQDMEFCQIQLNYVDWTFQNAKEKVDLLNRYNIPIWVMEPLRGGRLAKLPESALSKLTAAAQSSTSNATQDTTQSTTTTQPTPTSYAFRFIQGVPNVIVTLSGMSNFQQLCENIQTFSQNRPLSTSETKTLLSIADGMLAGILPCTGCRYCTSHCPQGLNIPHLLELYNEHSFTGGGFIAPMALQALPANKQPSACLACHSCERVCPQQIPIASALAAFNRLLNS